MAREGADHLDVRARVKGELAAREAASAREGDREHHLVGQVRLAKADGKSFGEFEKEFFEKIRPTSLIKRFASPEEIASLVVYIASPLASATTGAALRVDGGVVKSVI